MIKGIIFDFDNTLYDYETANTYALIQLFNTISIEQNIDCGLIKTMYNKINNNIKISNNSNNKFNKLIYFKQLLETANIPLHFLETYNNLYHLHFFEKFALYDGVLDLFMILKTKNIKIGILSNNIFSQQYEKLVKSRLIEYIDVIQTSDEFGEEKPSINLFYSIQNKMKLSYDQLAYIGDNYLHDIEPAISLNILTFWFNLSYSLQVVNNIIQFGNYSELLVFFNKYFNTITELIFLSKYFGQSVINIQGPGGNISVKLDNDILFIKSSGFILGNLSYNEGYCLVDINKCNTLVKTNTNKIKDTKIFGYKLPSMETYFHSFMKKYTVHLHFVLSNIVFCTCDYSIMSAFQYNYMIIDYFTPGLELAIEIYKKYDTTCDIYFLKNHGIIITSDRVDDIIKYYEYIFTFFAPLDNKYENELICNKMMQIYDKNQCSKVVKCLELPVKIFRNMIICFPDLAVFLQKQLSVSALTELEHNFDEYDMILYDHKVFLIADNITKLYSLIEIVNSYAILQLNSNSLVSIDNITKLQNMEEEKNRKL